MVSFFLLLFFTFCAGTAFGVRLVQGESDHRDGAGTLCLLFAVGAVISFCIHSMG